MEEQMVDKLDHQALYILCNGTDMGMCFAVGEDE
jgi:hypothetical protein